MEKSENKGKYGTVSLPLPLIDKVKEQIEGTGMHSVSAYVTFILRQILSEPQGEEVLGKDTEEKVKARLKSLGYL
ncbi:CopG family transcriptional regulator [Candidatus Pacearchaeota archaeon]|nr:CopG family transcriptional regulator [Candidatus Pacearchaeota archaeon]|tara:strand:+ start:10843 stop:11067 length:225 start_codon:yes stop_codon:yes gene_type:complete